MAFRKFFSAILCLLFLLFPSPSPVEATIFRQCRTPVSLAHSLMNRVAKNYSWRDLLTQLPEYVQIISDTNELLSALNEMSRATSETERAKWLMQNYQRILRVSGSLLRSLLVVFSQSETWRDLLTQLPEYVQIISDTNKLLSALNEMSRATSETERAKWLMQNHQRILRVSGSLLRSLLVVFSQSVSFLSEWEVRGELLRVCWGIGANDLKWLLLQVAAKQIVHYVSSSSASRELLRVCLEIGANELRVCLEIAANELRVCLEIGANDLKGLLQVAAKQIIPHYVSSSSASSYRSEL